MLKCCPTHHPLLGTYKKAKSLIIKQGVRKTKLNFEHRTVEPKVTCILSKH